ncbi:MAG: hypothetical protein QW222_05580 [Candidatus Bathyarchaeia archaeon]
MKDKIESFFERTAGKVVEYLDVGSKIIVSAGEKHYTLEVSEKGKIKVHEGRADGDLEIIGEESVINDLFSSTTMEEYIDKMCNYVVQGRKPKLKIHMERNAESIKRFMRTYYMPLLKMYIIR